MTEKLCRDCKHMIGGRDTTPYWQCDRKVDVVSGNFVLCSDERRGTSIAMPSPDDEWQSCAIIGHFWEANST